MRMKIRGKLLVLLMLIALFPLGISAYMHHRSLSRLGNHLAGEIRGSLTERAHAHLETVIDNFQRLQQGDQAALEWSLRFQKWEIEQPHSPPPQRPDRRENRWEGKGFLGAEPEGSVAEDGAHPGSLSDVFRMLDRLTPQPVLRRIVALESGTVVEYPAGREPLAGHDLRHQYWYQEAKKTGDLVWSAGAAPTDGKGTMIAALPLYLSAGAFAGVTAIEISLAEWFASPQFTQPWFGAVRKMLVVLAEPEKDDPMWRLHIIAEEAVEDRAGRVNGHFLEADDPGQMAVLLEDIRAGRPGSRLIRHGGHETHWIYGPAEAGKPFPLVIVSHEQLAAPAYAAEEHVRESLAAELKSTGLIFLGAIGLVVGLAVSSSRRVTLPLRRLAERAERLADGEYQSRIDIRTGDELQDLGDVFNTLGPRLQEREKMASALALAQVIQQRLLPQSAPRITGFDVAGACAFSDETGGDYYDFIELDGRWGIAVGDVTGHGIGSALIMAAARGTLRSYAGREELGALFEAINRHLIRDVEDQQFMTLFYAELDVANCSIQWNSAGQGPVFLYRRRSGEIDDLAVTGIPLGIMAESTWVPSGPLLLHAGDVLLVGTDGIWETRNPAGEMFGTRRLCRMLATLTDDSAAGICSAIVEQVKNFRGGKHSEDDLTVVVIRATG